jgi:hypothetical protein
MSGANRRDIQMEVYGVNQDLEIMALEGFVAGVGAEGVNCSITTIYNEAVTSSVGYYRATPIRCVM